MPIPPRGSGAIRAFAEQAMRAAGTAPRPAPPAGVTFAASLPNGAEVVESMEAGGWARTGSSSSRLSSARGARLASRSQPRWAPGLHPTSRSGRRSPRRRSSRRRIRCRSPSSSACSSSGRASRSRSGTEPRERRRDPGAARLEAPGLRSLRRGSGRAGAGASLGALARDAQPALPHAPAVAARAGEPRALLGARLLRLRPSPPADRTGDCLARASRRAAGEPGRADPLPPLRHASSSSSHGGARTLETYWLDAYGGGLFSRSATRRAAARPTAAAATCSTPSRGPTSASDGRRAGPRLQLRLQPVVRLRPRWACPLAPPANRLDLRIGAGERMWRDQ